MVEYLAARWDDLSAASRGATMAAKMDACWDGLTAALSADYWAVLLGAKGVVPKVASRAVTRVFCWVEHSGSSSVAAMVDQSVVV